jgi:hypothetical protein
MKDWQEAIEPVLDELGQRVAAKLAELSEAES